jgi:serine/threonine-protein kinase
VREDRAIALAWQAAMWARDPRRALTTVVQARADYVRDVNFSGPRAVLSARAHELAGNIEAAQTDWRVVLQRCEQDFAANPQDIPALCWKSWALARLGDLPGAQAAATLVRQRADSAASAYFSVMSRAQLWATVGWTDLAIEELGREKIALDRYTMTRAYLELEPAFDPIRNDPRFKALVASAPAPATEPKVLEKSLAVLPFDNLSEDKANEILSNGISNDLIHALGRLPGLTVKGATSSFYFKDQKQKIPPREMAAQLGVSYLVQGGVQKLGNTVRVSVLLSRAATDEIVWSSEPLRRELTDVFAIQDEIVGLVAKNLSLALGTPKVAARSVNQEAYVLYLQGMEVWRNRFGPDFYERWPQIEATMRRVVEIDPGFIGAMVRLSEALANREAPHAPLDAQGRPRPVLVEALEWADRAVAADRNSGEAHLSRADTLRQMWRPAEAESAYRRAIEINPSLALARARYARLLEAEGRMDEALLEYERATVLDPLAARAFDNQALTLLHAGRFRAALAAADRSLVLAPNNYQAFFYRALALHELGRPDEAKAVALKLAQMEPDPAAKSDFAGYTCELLFREGRRDEAAKLFDRIPRRLVADRIYAAAVLGRQRDVLAELSAQWLPPYWIDEVLWNPLFDSMRADAAFVAWLQKTNLTAAHARAQAWRAASPPEKPAPLK